LDGQRRSNNVIYGIRIEGRLPYVKVRSVAKQEPPYRPLPEVLAEQSVFEYTDIEGTLVGYWMPGYMEDVNFPAYHLHFVSADRTRGGHVLALTTGEGLKGWLDPVMGFSVELPKTDAFLDIGLSGGTGAQAATVFK
jgi:acetolactate decarboxylase